MHRFLITVIIAGVGVCNALEHEAVEAEFRSNRTGRVLKPVYKSPDRDVYKSGGYFGRNIDPSLYSDDFTRAKTDRQSDPPKTPRGFADFISGDQDSYSQPTNDQNRGWSPYYLPPVSDSMYDSSSSLDWNVWKREDDRSSDNTDFSYPKYNPDYSDMIMMMQAMKKMDPNSGSKPGLITRILDNPTTLVMATFIPLSLLLAASLPVIVNVMMNGITIPAFVSTASGAKTRGLGAESSPELLRSILESLADFNTRYLDSNECFQKIFCEMTRENTTNVTNVPGAKYLKQAVNVVNFVVNDDLLNSYGVKFLVDSIKSGKCDEIVCSKEGRSLSPSLLRVINQAIYSYSFKSPHEMR
ncbi:uncharacterized protein NPIL_166201 [Nephila pilipes]|uniref:Uncharacterized protein n=1 Tax=Nephila pilipes TaxID=299642 RepID=A0A8X6MTL0_NEPPI|nr:uncharacterized protein NPIL_166201 [Nephila pilipes]